VVGTIPQPKGTGTAQLGAQAVFQRLRQHQRPILVAAAIAGQR
jgi:hypothetical protein